MLILIPIRIYRENFNAQLYCSTVYNITYLMQILEDTRLFYAVEKVRVDKKY